ncbi:cell division protein FtsB [Clostridium acetireducens DSM 10703]|jgi:cell division protein FtsL|uniref:Cell division protein FtsB n=1 Tax=Clostridium acetireducens DSM 10703 TaxID=1121290 RepID=A0A1E8EZH3_9CLOT|nr:septum formation initiator family protein [Clostridium acetireducens]OFI06567.1 cell division protein FtsB [Clostridium acetireducens DSM 10703]
MKKKIKIKSILIIVILFYIVYIFINQQITMKKLKGQINNSKIELTKVKEKNQKLQDEVKMSKTSKYIEKLARERLGLVKQGETPVISNTK